MSIQNQGILSRIKSTFTNVYAGLRYAARSVPQTAVILAGLALIVAGGFFGTHSDRFDPRSENVTTITLNGGGEIMSFYKQYTDLRLSGKNLRIEGLCASACTFFLGLMPPDRVCATPYAKFGFHGIYTMFGPDFSTYKWFMPMVYPEWVLEKLRNVYGFDGSKADVDRDRYPGGIIWMDRDDLNVAHCN